MKPITTWNAFAYLLIGRFSLIYLLIDLLSLFTLTDCLCSNVICSQCGLSTSLIPAAETGPLELNVRELRGKKKMTMKCRISSVFGPCEKYQRIETKYRRKGHSAIQLTGSILFSRFSETQWTVSGCPNGLHDMKWNSDICIKRIETCFVNNEMHLVTALNKAFSLRPVNHRWRFFQLFLEFLRVRKAQENGCILCKRLVDLRSKSLQSDLWRVASPRRLWHKPRKTRFPGTVYFKLRRPVLVALGSSLAVKYTRTVSVQTQYYRNLSLRTLHLSRGEEKSLANSNKPKGRACQRQPREAEISSRSARVTKGIILGVMIVATSAKAKASALWVPAKSALSDYERSWNNSHLPLGRLNHDACDRRYNLKTSFSVGKETVASFILVRSAFRLGEVREVGPPWYLKIEFESATHIPNIFWRPIG